MDTALTTTHDDASMKPGLAGRLDEVRRLGRARRLRVQLPLGVFSVLVSMGSGAAAVTLDWVLLGAMGFWLGLWLFMLCVMPNDRRLIVLAIALVAMISAVTGAFLLIPLAKPCDPNFSRRSCITNHSVCAFAVLATALHFAHAVRIGMMLWLRSRPPRAALDSIWRCMGSGMVMLSLPFLIGASENVREGARYSPSSTSSHNSAELNFSTPVQAASRALLGVEYIVLGGLALWPRLRTVVQAKLASMGEGVAAAAGISELLGGAPTDELVALAQATVRSVRLDQLSIQHLDVRQPAADAYMVSTVAHIGAIDAFLSHSWHDPPEEKWRLLQAWRSKFMLEHGREPTVWLDRCCLQAEQLSSLLPCLPLYCAACDRLLALRGPTYLTRLWCAVEIFVFYEMHATTSPAADVSYIQVLDFESMPAYPALHYARCSTNLADIRFQTPERSRFDVRTCTCASPDDEAHLLAVMESAGAGFDAFNTWMHNLLMHARLPAGAVDGPHAARHSTGPLPVNAGRSSPGGAARGRRPPYGPCGPLNSSVMPIGI